MYYSSPKNQHFVVWLAIKFSRLFLATPIKGRKNRI